MSPDDDRGQPGALPLGTWTLAGSLSALVDSYGLLLALLILDYVLLETVTSPYWSGLVAGVPVAVSLVLALHVSHAKHHTIVVGATLIFGTFVLAALQAATGSNQVRAAVNFALALLLLLTPLTILSRILRHPRVELETLLGAVCVYVIIGLLFGFLYGGLAKVMSKPFLAQPGPHAPADYLYLSFVTLTTVGFGDLTPLTPAARSVVVLEALIGQIFLVTLVARLVALFGNERPPTGGDTADRAETGPSA